MFDYEYWQFESLPAAVNMALEEYFLERSTRKACLRLWDVPRDAAVLGYSQATDAIKKTEQGFNVVRRASGGSHIQIGPNVLAYTVTVPRDGTFSNYEDMRAYYAGKIANALEGFGIQNITIDNRASTINVDGKVVASHAIVWGVNSALLHGLVIINPYDVDKLSGRLILGKRKMGSKTYTEYSALKNIPAISQLLAKIGNGMNQKQRTEALKEMIGDGIVKSVTDGKFSSKRIGREVLTKSYELIKKKYGQDQWTNLKKPAFTKERIEAIPGEKLDGPLKKGLGYCLYIQVKDKDFKKMSDPI